MIFYLTYNEAPSGVYSSQVIDVVSFIGNNFNQKVKLVAVISLRNYFLNRKIIKSQLPASIVLPMYPKMRNWRMSGLLIKLICLFYEPKIIIARSVMATKLALDAREKGLCKSVVYDGRGAIAPEWREYGVVTDRELLEKIEEYEKEVICNADLRIAVSQALVNWWRDTYGYEGKAYVIIPCTLSSSFLNIQLSETAIQKKRASLNLNANDTVFIYSGSLAGWQSFELTQSFIIPLLEEDKEKKIIFLSPAHKSIKELMERFPQQIILKQLEANEVQEYLIVGDYGLLIREPSQTNKVASPVKYAEYLSCGLKVIISEDLGDYSEISAKNNWGFVFSKFDPSVSKPTITDKIKISEQAINYFSKKMYRDSYHKIIDSALNHKI